VPDVVADAEYDQPLSQALRNRSSIGVPMLRDGQVVGAIGIGRLEVRPFTEKQIALLQTFAAQAGIAIENVRLFHELETRNRDLAEALERQTATSDVLRVISSSPTDLQPVFDALVRTAAHLCEASYGFLARYDGTSITIAAHSGASEAEI